MDPWCIFGGYVELSIWICSVCLGNHIHLVKSCQVAHCDPWKIVINPQLYSAGVSPGGLLLFPWSIYKVLNLSLYSNLVLWGAICYTQILHWSCHLDSEPALALSPWHHAYIWLHCTSTVPHRPCISIGWVISYWSNLKNPKNLVFSPPTHPTHWKPTSDLYWHCYTSNSYACVSHVSVATKCCIMTMVTTYVMLQD